MAEPSPSESTNDPLIFPKTQSKVLPNPNLFVSPHLLQSPLPTNSFFQNFVLKNGDQSEYIHPYLIKSAASSLSLSYPTRFSNFSLTYQVFKADVTISVTHKTKQNTPKNHVISSFSDLGVTLDIPSTNLQCFLSRGSPFVTCSVSNPITQLSISTVHAFLSCSCSNNSRTKYKIKINNNQTWLLYASSAINLKLTNDKLVTSGGFSGIIRIAMLPGSNPKSESFLDKFSSCYRVCSNGAFTKPFCLEYKWEKKGCGDLLVLAHPLHLQLLSVDESNAICFE